ncbi:hypothetical protein B0H67DRAFT_305131 [Lasiosphaeris hirsuta]|uniref:Uncharacterized protein n=1 Tax=Lasiosphaeris hirsuta TaxID=260670 RepID=A0AA40DSQ2_9PEZI|nr:hypothetical protein B0H67DRAFT_305131 [Lasiosphaeris hirsuta]
MQLANPTGRHSTRTMDPRQRRQAYPGHALSARIVLQSVRMKSALQIQRPNHALQPKQSPSRLPAPPPLHWKRAPTANPRPPEARRRLPTPVTLHEQTLRQTPILALRDLHPLVHDFRVLTRIPTSPSSTLPPSRCVLNTDRHRRPARISSGAILWPPVCFFCMRISQSDK